MARILVVEETLTKSGKTLGSLQSRLGQMAGSLAHVTTPCAYTIRGDENFVSTQRYPKRYKEGKEDSAIAVDGCYLLAQ
jgi:hypothetical protein